LDWIHFSPPVDKPMVLGTSLGLGEIMRVVAVRRGRHLRSMVYLSCLPGDALCQASRATSYTNFYPLKIPSLWHLVIVTENRIKHTSLLF
jgi:pimeloyl-ACP methyl ester carboxylesterase